MAAKPRSESAARFLAALDALRNEAKLSFKALERMTGRMPGEQLMSSTTHKRLQGPAMPEWSFVLTLVEACHKARKVPLTDDERAKWRQRCDAAKASHEKDEATPPADDVPPAQSVEAVADAGIEGSRADQRRRFPITAIAVVTLLFVAVTATAAMTITVMSRSRPEYATTRPPSYEGDVVRASNGSMYWIRNGQKRYVPGETILKCLQGRAGVPSVVDVPGEVVNGFPSGPDAYCPYEQEQGLNFVQEGDAYDPDRTTWLVGLDGDGLPFKRLARRLCVDDPRDAKVAVQYHVGMVPVGEVTGRYQGSDFWGDNGGPVCQALPKWPG